MLGPTFRFSVQNTAGVTATVTVKYTPWYINSSGALTFGPEVTDSTINALAVTSGSAWVNGATQANSSGAIYMGALLDVTIAVSSAPTTGTNLVVQIQRSLDGGTTWPTDGQGEFVGSFTFTTATGTYHQPMTISGG